ncbi:hypothetical protein EVAR_43395_1 [Eumeta japonica]|uniref:Uncharacterized protein n=1 Tax=Eumeta variegata TaxID=151549 RepID=A0A4C1WWT2_EUMVA|nr:hypothetical protein EVAR_43395_1 [Eumeta japonica]
MYNIDFRDIGSSDSPHCRVRIILAAKLPQRVISAFGFASYVKRKRKRWWRGRGDCIVPFIARNVSIVIRDKNFYLTPRPPLSTSHRRPPGYPDASSKC